ncbi:lipopolysaccharide biosynthesis protein [Haloarcula onubensis]|uniref:Lipopolysaccharide biosynthesis protein n=1 Tax=Haloarcula onubensis TaxID=2950539 RepID=A0ABU2FLF4_9EURY|nr:lipopolysaccharide biosynthesis protein [Halomicroarcula sp. S3CR25-11]MDS0281596.1 lipopolysaccharide biosynthesis protein [Halomicroarcula sp. S3CR25-11]
MSDRLDRVLNWLVPSGSVLQRAVKSGMWVGITRVAMRSSQLIMLVVLARLLSPTQFGLMGISLLLLSGTRKFSRFGLDAALIQKKEKNVDSYLNTTWCLEIGRGLLLFGVLYAIAPFAATQFGEPNAEPLIRTLGLVPLLHGLRNPAVVYFEKDLAFHKSFIYQASGGLAQLIVGIGYALYSPTVWALVAASLAKPTVRTTVSYLLDDFRPWPRPDLGAAKELIEFGKWMTGGSILGFLSSEGDDAFVGWFLSATALGFYQYAYRMADLPATQMSGVLSQVTFPAYSELQRDLGEVRSAVLQTTRLTAFFAFPMAFGIALVAPSFVPVVLGEQWTPMVVSMQILAFYGLFHAITRNFGELWKSQGRPDIQVKLGLVRIACLAVTIWPAASLWGIEGVAVAVTGVYLFPMVPLDVYITAKMLETTSMQIYREFVYPFVAGVTMFGSLWYVQTMTEWSSLVELVVLIPAGAAIYAATAFLLESQFEWGIKQLFGMVVQGIR